jgi:hypothetical protein
MPDATSSGPVCPAQRDARREPPPPSLVEAAEHDYRSMRARLAEMTCAVRSQLDQGSADVEAVADVWQRLREQQDRPATMLLAAVSIVQLAKTPQPPQLGDASRTSPHSESAG